MYSSLTLDDKNSSWTLDDKNSSLTLDDKNSSPTLDDKILEKNKIPKYNAYWFF